MTSFVYWSAGIEKTLKVESSADICSFSDLLQICLGYLYYWFGWVVWNICVYFWPLFVPFQTLLTPKCICLFVSLISWFLVRCSFFFQFIQSVGGFVIIRSSNQLQFVWDSKSPLWLRPKFQPCWNSITPAAAPKTKKDKNCRLRPKKDKICGCQPKRNWQKCSYIHKRQQIKEYQSSIQVSVLLGQDTDWQKRSQCGNSWSRLLSRQLHNATYFTIYTGWSVPLLPFWHSLEKERLPNQMISQITR